MGSTGTIPGKQGNKNRFSYFGMGLKEQASSWRFIIKADQEKGNKHHSRPIGTNQVEPVSSRGSQLIFQGRDKHRSPIEPIFKTKRNKKKNNKERTADFHPSAVSECFLFNFSYLLCIFAFICFPFFRYFFNHYLINQFPNMT